MLMQNNEVNQSVQQVLLGGLAQGMVCCSLLPATLFTFPDQLDSLQCLHQGPTSRPKMWALGACKRTNTDGMILERLVTTARRRRLVALTRLESCWWWTLARCRDLTGGRATGAGVGGTTSLTPGAATNPDSQKPHCRGCHAAARHAYGGPPQTSPCHVPG
jgi:hypothetical protein